MKTGMRIGMQAKQGDSLLVELRGYLLACIGDAEGLEAVDKHRVLRLTAGQVQCLNEALFLVEAELGIELTDA